MIVLPAWFQAKWHELRMKLADAIERGDDSEAFAVRRRMDILADNLQLDLHGENR